MREVFSLNQHPLCPCRLTTVVSRERKGGACYPVFFSGSSEPRFVGEVGISRASQNLTANLIKFLLSIGKSKNLGRTQQAEISGVKEESEPTSLVIRERTYFTSIIGLGRIQNGE